MLTDKEVKVINDWLLKGFEIEIFRKPDGTLSVKTVKRRKLNID